MFSVAMLASAAFCCAKEYRADISKYLSVGTSQSYECVAVMAHLAGFEEFNKEDTTGKIASYDEYFKPYLKNPKVKKSLSYIKKLRRSGFSYDAIGSAGTYLNTDCHSYRVDYDILKKYLDPRCGNPEKLLNAVSTFYDETHFEEFYDSNISFYGQTAQIWLSHSKDLQKAIEEVQKYYKSETNKVFISSSILNYNNNFGTSFNDGKNVYFEPKYCAFYYDDWLIVHELSHPCTRPVVDELYKNPEIKKYFESHFNGSRAKIMKKQAYGTPYISFNELINRANEIAVLQNYLPDTYVKQVIKRYIENGFTEIELVLDILQPYRTGNYASLMDFEPILEKELTERITITKVLVQ